MFDKVLLSFLMVYFGIQHIQTLPLKGEPSFCRGLQCPEYKVVMHTDDFEERCYQEYKWASTDMSGAVPSIVRALSYIIIPVTIWLSESGELTARA